jgi:protein-disulfide isomerase
MSALLGLMLAFGCTGEPAAPAVSKPVSRPVAGAEGAPDAAPVPVPTPQLSRPDGRMPLYGSDLGPEDLPPLGLEALSDEAREAALVAINNTYGPCEPCMEGGKSIARCLVMAPEGCENMASVARRAVRAAGEGLDAHEVIQRVRFVDPWLPIDGPERARRGPDDALTVVLALDYTDPFSKRSAEVWEALSERYGDRVAFELLHRPDLERHPLAGGAALAVLAAGRQGAAFAAHDLLLSVEGPPTAEVLDGLAGALGLDAARYAADRADPALAGRQEEDLALAERLGVRGTPTTFIAGYRVRGLRELAFYTGMIDALLADAEDAWPREQ